MDTEANTEANTETDRGAITADRGLITRILRAGGVLVLAVVTVAVLLRVWTGALPL